MSNDKQLEKEIDEKIQYRLDRNKAHRDELQSELEKVESAIRLDEDLLEQRTIARHFRTHPQLTPVAIGDKVTLEGINESAKKAIRMHTSDWHPANIEALLSSQELVVESIRFYKSISESEADVRFVVGRQSIPLDLKVVSEMRRAYLAQQGETI